MEQGAMRSRQRADAGVWSCQEPGEERIELPLNPAGQTSSQSGYHGPVAGVAWTHGSPFLE